MIHDILLVRRHDWNTKEINAVFDMWLRSITKVATGLICPTQAVVNEVQSWLIDNSPQDLTKLWICSSHHGADIKNSLPSAGMPDNAAFILKHLRSKNSFLMVGTVEPRKAHAQTLVAFELLWQQGIDINLVIVGKQGWMVDDLAKKVRKHTELNRRLFWLEGISDEFLEQVYKHCTCLIAPSEGEGFGLPLIEAAQHKLPIIARDIPVFREIAMNYAYYFSGLTPLDLANAVQKWLIMHNKGMAPQSVDMPYLTWQESAQQLIEYMGLSTTNQHTTKKEA
jgi:glycosyltransferase involved in cell wall biosynthesis